MKLRINGNSIRLRVTQGELRQIAAGGPVEESVDFGVGPELHYRLCLDPSGEDLSAEFDAGILSVRLPCSDARRWCDTELVSLRGEQPLPDGVLKLLVEKDFRCLAEREDEDETDMFDHPLAEES